MALPYSHPVTRLCRAVRRRGRVAPKLSSAEQKETLRDRIANVEAIRRGYQARLEGEPSHHGTRRHLNPATLRENIARCTARLADLRAQLAAL